MQGSMLQSIERYMKQAIVDKEPSVSSAALTSSLVSPREVFSISYWVLEAELMTVESRKFGSSACCY
jgi:coatomer protein complex subunit gamma